MFEGIDPLSCLGLCYFPTWLGLKADRVGAWRMFEFVEGQEDNNQRLLMGHQFLFDRSQTFVAAEGDESAYHRDVDLNRALAAQHA